MVFPTLDSAFSAAKLLLSAIPVLTHPVPGAAVSLAVDVSDSHVGAVLQQCTHGSWSPLAFFSKKLSSPKSKYSTFDCELLAAYSAVCHFCFLLEAREFTLFTNHKPLTHTLFRSSPPWSARQTRPLAYISEFTSDIVHGPGSENVAADTLSCPYSPVPASSTAVPVSPPFPLTSPPPTLTFPLSLLCSLSALQSSPCCPARPSPLSLCLSKHPPSTVMCPWGLRGHWFQFLYAISCSCLSTNFLILVFDLPALPKMSASGRDPASDASRVRSSLTSGLHFLVWRFLEDVFLMCIWIWWDPCLQARDIVIY